MSAEYLVELSGTQYPAADDSRPIGNLAGRPGKRQDVQAGPGAVRRVDVAPVVHLDVVGLDGGLAAPLGSLAGTKRPGPLRGGGDEEPGLDRVEGIADVHGPHARVEIRHEDDLLVIDRRKRFL